MSNSLASLTAQYTDSENEDDHNNSDEDSDDSVKSQVKRKKFPFLQKQIKKQFSFSGYNSNSSNKTRKSIKTTKRKLINSTNPTKSTSIKKKVSSSIS